MAYIGWASNVNKTILDSTSVTVGENATVQDSLESGGQGKIRLKCANPPDRYSVTMEFDFSEKGKDGLTELERFYAWYKWAHCYGANPFEFPAILINSNRQDGYSQEEISYGKIADTEYYIITSAIEGSKSGLCQQITMTWETFATGVITIPADTVTVDDISAYNGYVDIFLTGTPVTEPGKNTYSVFINSSPQTITAAVYDGDSTVRYYFEEKTEKGVYVVQVSGKEKSFVVE